MYKFWIDDMLLPVTPGKFTAKLKNKNKTYDIIGGGEINIPKKPGLWEFSFSFTLPAREGYPFAQYPGGKFQPPNYYTSILRAYKTQKTVCDFLITREIGKLRASAQSIIDVSADQASPDDRYLYDLNGDGEITAADARIRIKTGNGIYTLARTRHQCTIEDLSLREDASREGADITVDITLKEYRDYGLKTATYTIRSDLAETLKQAADPLLRIAETINSIAE